MRRVGTGWKESRVKEDSLLFIADSRPTILQRVYAGIPPKPALDRLDEFRDDRQPCMKLYSNPQFFMDDLIRTLEAKEKERRDARRGKRPKKVKQIESHYQRPKQVQEVAVKRYDKQGNLIVPEQKRSEASVGENVLAPTTESGGSSTSPSAAAGPGQPGGVRVRKRVGPIPRPAMPPPSAPPPPLPPTAMLPPPPPPPSTAAATGALSAETMGISSGDMAAAAAALPPPPVLTIYSMEEAAAAAHMSGISVSLPTPSAIPASAAATGPVAGGAADNAPAVAGAEGTIRLLLPAPPIPQSSISGPHETALPDAMSGSEALHGLPPPPPPPPPVVAAAASYTPTQRRADQDGGDIVAPTGMRDPRQVMLEQIRGGAKLRRVEAAPRHKSVAVKSQPLHMQAMSTAITALLSRRAAMEESDEESGEEEDANWDD